MHTTPTHHHQQKPHPYARQLLLIALLGLFGWAWPAPGHSAEQTAYDFQFEGIDGEIIDLADYRGKPLLIVNVASQCGFTPQYEQLQTLYAKYKDRGLTVIGVPSNNFGGQEPGSNVDIQQFAGEKFNVTFPLAAKTDVTGPGAHPFYRWTRQEKGPTAVPLWNFHKFLIGPDGHIADWFSSFTGPMDEKVQKAVESALSQQE